MNAKEMLFLRDAVPAAQASMRAWSVPASVTLAQAILESGWGSSQLTLLAKNYFGMKAEHAGEPDTYEAFPTAEYENGQRVMITADFEKYATAADCFTDHGRLLATAPRYAPAMAAKGNAAAFAGELQKCGYSTSPDYAATLTTLMDEFDLEQYDVLPAPQA